MRARVKFDELIRLKRSAVDLRVRAFALVLNTIRPRQVNQCHFSRSKKTTWCLNGPPCLIKREAPSTKPARANFDAIIRLKSIAGHPSAHTTAKSLAIGALNHARATHLVTKNGRHRDLFANDTTLPYLRLEKKHPLPCSYVPACAASLRGA